MQRRRRVLFLAAHHADDGKVEPGRELEIARVVSGYSHDRPRSVLHQHVIGHPDRNFLFRGGIYRIGSGEDSRLFGARLSRDDVLLLRLVAIGVDFLFFLRAGELFDQRMLGCKHHVGRAVDGVWTRREDPDLALHSLHVLGGKRDLRPFGAADPVPLRGLCGLRPVDVIEILEQPRRVVADAEEPLLKQTLLDRRPASLAMAADYLLVGQHGLILRAPVDRSLLLVGEPLLEELKKEPLCPLVVVGLGGRERIAPIDHESCPFELSPEVGDVAGNEIHRMLPDLEGVVLRMNPEGVVPERLEHVVSHEPLESSMNVVPRERKKIPDVESFGGRIGEHHQCVVRPLGALQVRVVGPTLLPDALPLPLDCLWVVSDDRGGERVVPCCRIVHP